MAGRRWLFRRDESGSRQILEDGDPIMCDEKYYPWCPDEDADWHLMAAALDLYKYCSELLEEYEGAGYCPSETLIANAKSALAKARGESGE